MSAKPATRMGRRLWLRTAAAAPLAGLLAACVVAPYGEHYRASTGHAGARPRRAWCGGQAGPVTGVDLDLGAGLLLRAWTGTVVERGVPLHAVLTVPAGAALRFTEPVQLLADTGVLAVPVRFAARRTIAVDAADGFEPQRLRPGSGSVGTGAPHGRLVLHLEPEAPVAPERIAVQGLVLQRDAEVLRLPPMALARPASPRQPDLYRSEGQLEALRSRAAACRRDTPHLACDNILQHGGGSDAGTLPGLAWTGHWTRRSGSAGGTLAGEITLALQERGRWRVDPSALQVRDLDRGTVHPLRIVRSELSFEDSIGQPGIAPAAAETRVFMNALLPKDVPSFSLQLPVLQIGGRSVEVPPVRFERRTTDGGAQPFNC